MGSPIAPLIHVLTPFFLAEFTWSRTLSPLFTCTHFLLFFVGPHRAMGTICNDRRSLPYAAGGLGALLATQQVQSRALVGVELRKSGILRYKIQPKNSTSWFSFFVQNEFKRKNHPFDVPSKANDMFARILKS